jgi:hypothetical protein
MDNEGALRGLTMTRLPEQAQVKRQNRRERVIFFITLLTYLPFFVVFSQMFAQAWHAASWGDFWSLPMLQVFSALLTAMLLVRRVADYLRKRARSRAYGLLVAPLRQAVRTGDENIAPLVETQPETLTPTNLSFGMSRRGTAQTTPLPGG